MTPPSFSASDLSGPVHRLIKCTLHVGVHDLLWVSYGGPLRKPTSCCHLNTGAIPSGPPHRHQTRTETVASPGVLCSDGLRRLSPPRGWGGCSSQPSYCPPQEDWALHDTRLGALAAGLIIVDHKFPRNLPGDIEEAAGGRGVSTN